MLNDVIASGTLNVTVPPFPMIFDAMGPRFAEMKSSPGRVTRTDAAFGMTDA
jgi:hypothetical protein